MDGGLQGLLLLLHEYEYEYETPWTTIIPNLAPPGRTSCISLHFCNLATAPIEIECCY